MQKAHGVTKAKEIRVLISARLKMWEEGQVKALVGDAEVEAQIRAGVVRQKANKEQRFLAFNA